LEELAAAQTSPTRSASMRLVLKGKGELDRGRFERAAHLMTQAIEVDAQNPFAYFYMGMTRFQSSRFSQSCELFRRAGDLFQGEPEWQAEAFARQGESLEKQNLLKPARKVYLQAVRLDAFNERAISGLERIRKDDHD